MVDQLEKIISNTFQVKSARVEPTPLKRKKLSEHHAEDFRTDQTMISGVQNRCY